MAESDDNPSYRRTIVRGADGALYLIDRKKPPVKLTTAQSEAVTNIIKQAETQLSSAAMPIIGSGVNHEPPQLFDNDNDDE